MEYVQLESVPRTSGKKERKKEKKRKEKVEIGMIVLPCFEGHVLGRDWIPRQAIVVRDSVLFAEPPEEDAQSRILTLVRNSSAHSSSSLPD